MADLFRGIRDKIDFRLTARQDYETRVASKNRILDVGGRNSYSKSRKQIDSLSKNPNRTIVCTDIIPSYGPDLVDDISNTSIKPNSFDGVYCDAILEHVEDYWKAIDNIYDILEKGGELFLYVPFMFQFHDLMDFHRFTFAEVARMLDRFPDVKVFVAGEADGFGWLLWYVLTMTTIGKFRRLHRGLGRLTDSVLRLVLSAAYKLRNEEILKTYGDVSLDDYCYFYLYLFMNHGFCAWARK